jgi:hypothetical protein
MTKKLTKTRNYRDYAQFLKSCPIIRSRLTDTVCGSLSNAVASADAFTESSLNIWVSSQRTARLFMVRHVGATMLKVIDSACLNCNSVHTARVQTRDQVERITRLLAVLMGERYEANNGHRQMR